MFYIKYTHPPTLNFAVRSAKSATTKKLRKPFVPMSTTSRHRGRFLLFPSPTVSYLYLCTQIGISRMCNPTSKKNLIEGSGRRRVEPLQTLRTIAFNNDTVVQFGSKLLSV